MLRKLPHVSNKYSVRIHGWIAHGSVHDEVYIYLDSSHFNSGLVLSGNEVQGKKSE